jgi:hypothetical protein
MDVYYLTPKQQFPKKSVIPHAFSGNPGGVGLDPRLRRSGVTAPRAASLHPTPIFKGEHQEHEVSW